MSFSADWLALRAPFDASARAAALEDRLAAWAAGRALRIVDLGAGSGNNLAHLAPRLPGPQDWTLIDSDDALLAQAARRHPRATVRQADLTGDLDGLIPAATDIVTASALIDLVSRDWLARLTDRLRAVGCALLVVLTYDGRIEWDGETDADREIADLVNRHQRGDKGFGRALGPDAPAALADLLAGVETAMSDWIVRPEDAPMRAALVDGWAGAAIDLAPARSDAIAAWRDRARATPRRLLVGHKDQLWLPPF